MTDAIPEIEGWDAFIDGLRGLAPAMLGQLPAHLRADPQIRQEVARLMLESVASLTIGAIGHDPDHPVFLPSLGKVLNVGQPNADTIYRGARIASGGTYRLRGRRGSVRIAKIAQMGLRPNAGAGQSGVETLDVNDLNSLTVDADSRYDVILSPTRPAGHDGDWWPLNPGASNLLLRLVASDWDKEVDPTLSIERLDGPATSPRRPAADLETRLRQLPMMIAGMARLLVSHVVELQAQGYINKMRVFDVQQIGGQLTGQFYYEGAYDLAEDEALIIEAKVPERYEYYSLILTNEIYETTDWYNNHASLSDAQLRVDADGVLRVVVSARDPGVPNWLDTAGHPRGAVQGRWTECSDEPIPTVRRLAVADVRAALPADTPKVTPAEREALIRDRRSAVQQRPLW